jgi:hypothetical protein
LLAIALVTAQARAEDTSAVDQIVAVLKEKGLIDQATSDEILAKQAKAEAKEAASAKPAPVGQGLLEGFVWSGDLRLRDEQFWYSKGLEGVSADDNNRIRYRARFGFTKQVNPWAVIGVRIATDTTDYRSTNITVGQSPDFSYDSIFLDQAYAKFLLPDPGINVKTAVLAGKFSNPYIWRLGLDKMMWDEDITPEGIAVTPTWQATESTKIWANLGYFVELQQASLVDPRVWAYQLNGSQKIGEMFELGARVSYYDWENLENDPSTVATPTALATSGFFARTFANGNQPIAFKNGGARIIESSGYLTVNAIDDWPALIWGTWIGNLSAHGGVVNGVSVSAQNNAWGVGVEIGDVKKWARLGVAYQYVEANGVIAEYTDSDMFDGRTNRRGYAFYGARELAENTELKISLWEQDPIKTTQSGVPGGPYNISPGTDSQTNRSRLQVDLNFKY